MNVETVLLSISFCKTGNVPGYYHPSIFKELLFSSHSSEMVSSCPKCATCKKIVGLLDFFQKVLIPLQWLEAACLWRAVAVTWTHKTEKCITTTLFYSRWAPTHHPCCLRRKMNLESSSSLLCDGICIYKSPASFTVDGTSYLCRHYYDFNVVWVRLL